MYHNFLSQNQKYIFTYMFSTLRAKNMNSILLVTGFIQSNHYNLVNQYAKYKLLMFFMWEQFFKKHNQSKAYFNGR